MRNHALGLFGVTSEEKDAGFLFQNLVYQSLREVNRISSANIHSWRTKDGAEVDFVIDAGREQIPVEVTYCRLKEPRVTRSLRSFIEKYQPERAVVVNLALDARVQFHDTEVRAAPFYRFEEAVNRMR